MKEISLVKIKNPFSLDGRETDVIPYHGETLAEIRKAHAPADVDTIVSINGHVVPKEQWPFTRAIPGDMVVMRPSVGDGDILRSLAFVALIVVSTIVAPELTPFLATAEMTELAVTCVTFAMIVAGGMLINAILPPSTPTAGSLSDFDTSQSYSFSPSTIQAQGTAIPRIYGTMKAFGNVISTYTENIGDKTYLNVLLGLGYGPYQRLYDYKINDQPAENFNGVEIHTRLGKLTQSVIPNFDDTKVEFPLSVKLVCGTPHVYMTDGDAFDGLEVDILCPKGLFYSNDNGGLDSHEVQVVIEYRKVGDADWTVLSWAELYQDVRFEVGYWSRGTTHFLRWFGNDINTWDEKEIGSSNPTDHYDGERGSGTPTGSTWWRWIPADSSLRLTVAANQHMIISAAKTSAVRRTVKIGDNLAHGQYEIRVSKTSEDQTSSRYGDDVYFSSVREVSYAAYTYPRQTLVGIKALASDQLSGSLRFSCLCEGSYIRAWNGSTWSIEWSNNPAWVCYDVFTQPVFDDTFNTVLRYDGIDPARIDHEAFKVWADFCDELVDDGVGGTEKRFIFNGTFDVEMTLWDAGLKIASMSRAMLLFSGYKITVYVDKAASPVQLFTSGNIIQDSFKETWLPVEERAGEIEISYINQDNDYARDTLPVINSDLDHPSNRVSMQLMGASKASQVWRSGQFLLLCNKYLKRTIEFEADIDAIACTLGDVVNFAHSVPQWGLASGRIVYAADPIAGFTCNLSLATGYVFISNPSTDLSGYIDKYLTLKDGAGKKLILRLDSAGTGETSSGELLLNTSFENTVGLTPINSTLASISGGDSGNCLEATKAAEVFYQGHAQMSILTVGGLYNCSIKVKSGSSGNETARIYLSSYASISIVTSSSWQTLSGKLTAGVTGYYAYKIGLTAGTMLFDTASCKQILTPSVSGAHCTMITEESGFDRYAASYTAYFSLSTATYDQAVTLDQEVTLAAGKTYVIMLRLDDDTLVTRTILDGPGTYTELHLTAPWGTIPTPYCPFAVGESGYATKPVRVLDISRTGDQRASIKAIEYNASIYAVDTDTPVIPTPNYSTLVVMPSVTSLDLKERLLKRIDGTIVVMLDIAFTPPLSTYWSYGEIWASYGGGWQYVGTSYNGQFTIENVPDQKTCQIAVLSVNKTGERQRLSESPTASLYIYGKTALPGDITEIWAEAAQGGLKLTWTPVTDLDLSHYKIRWTADLTSGSWSNSIDVGIAKTSTVTIPAARSGRYYVKAVDTTGNESETAISVETTIPGILAWNVQETQVQEPGWTGTKSGMVAVAGVLTLDAIGDFDDVLNFDAITDFDGYSGGIVSSGTYETASIDLGSVQTCRCSIELSFIADTLLADFDAIEDFDAITNLNGADNTNAGIVPQIALSQNGSTWGAWQNFITGDYTARAFKARLSCFSLDGQSYVDIYNASFIVDMPDREESAADVTCPVGGLSITFSKAFMAVPRIGVTAQGLQTGDYYELTSKTVNGFGIIFKNSAGTGVSRTMDWAARGY